MEKIFISKNIDWDERELAVIAALNEMYSSKHKYLYTSISMIGYELTGKFLKTKNKRERTIIASIHRGIDLLVERNIIEIIDQDGDLMTVILLSISKNKGLRCALRHPLKSLAVRE